MSDNPTFSPPKSWIKIDLRHSFMIFSILLLGIFLITSLIIVDYLSHPAEQHKTFFGDFVIYLKSIDILKGSYLIAPLSIFILYGIGLTIHLLSYFFVSAPAMIISSWIPLLGRKHKVFKRFDDKKLNKILKDVDSNIGSDERYVFKRGFLYLILQQYDTPISSDLKFVFIQLIYARTISFILWLDTSIYIYLSSNHTFIVWLSSSILLLFLIWITYIFHINNFEHILRMSYYADAYTKKNTNGTSNTENSPELLISVGEQK